MSEGLSSLFSGDKKKSDQKEIDINLIVPNKDQPRKHFDEEALNELSDSIKENGIIQPLTVKKTESGYELIAGERRLRASKIAGLAKVPVYVKEVTDKEKSILAIIENLQREDLSPIELAESYKRAMEDYQLSQIELAKKLGKARSSIANILRLLALPEKVKEIAQLNSSKVTSGHLKVLASVKDEEKAISLTEETVKNNLTVQKLSNLCSDKKEKVEKIEVVLPPRFKDLESICKLSLKNEKKEEGSLSLKFSSYEDLLEKIKKIKNTIKDSE